ncbi:MAG: UDP-glucose/GDP-mannose dehydrogenase family protein [candidate division WOR-3 bacterium]|nr:UDP-glucose/GDP-mannose dehydrogenase family protein [candidate division WOR-3 bacterium]MCX7757150.1 UDP-glucose/GDP-mannose dehydrogenase family protein [candidate division WOR-3 bacterium]
MNIGIIGAGYVGLTTAACFAHLGHNVICVDNDENKIKILLSGKIPFYEPGLDKLVIENITQGRLQFTTQTQKAVKESLVLFIAVGTPPKESGEPDLSYVENVAQEIGSVLNDYRVIVEKSTVPVKTGDWIKETITRYNKSKAPFDVASNPEFLREGSAINDFLNPDRIVIGVESDRAKEILLQIYEPINAPKIITDIKSAELIKHASNAFLAMKISFINSISIICELAGASVDKVAQGIGLDKRIGPAFLNAGVGYGGFCFPKDLKAFIKIAEELGYDYRLLKEVERINEEQKQRFVKKIEGLLWNLRGKQIGILGLAFKPNTDDMRFAPSIDIINELQARGAKIKAYDPYAMNNAKKILKDVTYCNDPYEVAKNSEALVIITEWDEFRNLDLMRIKELLKLPIIVDGRNIFDPPKMAELGFIYRSVGR